MQASGLEASLQPFTRSPTPMQVQPNSQVEQSPQHQDSSPELDQGERSFVPGSSAVPLAQRSSLPSAVSEKRNSQQLPSWENFSLMERAVVCTLVIHITMEYCTMV